MDNEITDLFTHQNSIESLGNDPSALASVKWDQTAEVPRADGKVETRGYDAKSGTTRVIAVADGKPAAEPAAEPVIEDVEENGVTYRVETRPDGSQWFLGRKDKPGGMSVQMRPPTTQGAPVSDTPSAGQATGTDAGTATGEGATATEGADKPERLIDSVVDDMTGMVQGVVPSALKGAKPAPKELVDLYNDESIPEEQRRALVTDLGAKQGLTVGFRRVEGTTNFEPVLLTPDMRPPGGLVGQVADFVGRLLGWNNAEPVVGAATKTAQAAKAIKSGAKIGDGAVMGMGGVIADSEKDKLIQEAVDYLKTQGIDLTAEGSKNLKPKDIADLSRELPEGFKSGEIPPEAILKYATKKGFQPLVHFPAKGEVPARIVFHGSPHDFEAFDLSKINTGEGAQSFGHGLYFTDKEDLAKYYRDKLVRGRATKKITVNGKPISHPFDIDKGWGKLSPEDQGKQLAFEALTLSPDVKEAVNYIVAQVDNAQATINRYETYKKNLVTQGKNTVLATERLDEQIKEAHESYERTRIRADAALAQLDKWQAEGSGISMEKSKGSLHAVAIPADDTFVLYDKPFAEQPPKVKEAIENFIRKALDAAWDGEGTPEPDALKNIMEFLDPKRSGLGEFKWDLNSWQGNVVGMYGTLGWRTRTKAAAHSDARDYLAHAKQAGNFKGKMPTDDELKDFLADIVKHREAFDSDLNLKPPTMGQFLASVDHDTSVFETLPQLLSHPDHKGNDQELISKLLKDEGISGFKYLNGQSRKKGDGDFNYVLFDDELIKSLAKYGIVGSVAIGAAASANDAEAATNWEKLGSKLGIMSKDAAPVHSAQPLPPGGQGAVAAPFTAAGHAAAQGDLWAGYKGGRPQGVDFNFDNLRTNDSVLEQINNVSHAYAETIDTQKKGVIPHEVTRQVADMLGMDPKAAEAAISKLPGDVEDLHVRALVMRDMLVSAAERVDATAQKVLSEASTDKDLLDFREHLAHFAVLQANMKGVQTEIARALSAFRIPANGGPLLRMQLTRESIDALGGADTARELAKRWVQTPPEAKGEVLKQGWFAKTKDAVFEAWINGLLSSIRTTEVNVMSNALFAAWQVPERALAGVFGAARQLLPNANPDRVMVGEGVALLHGYIESLPDAMRLAWTTFKNDAPSLAGDATKIEGQQVRAISAEKFGLDESGILGRFVDLVGTGVRLPGRFLMAQDEFYKAAGRSAESRAIGLRMYNEALDAGKTVEEAKAIYGEVMRGESEFANNAIGQYANMVTFTKQLGPTGQAIQVALNKVPGGRVVAPFIRTPGNLFSEEFARTPAAIFQKAFRDDLAAGGARRDLALARASLGTAVMAYGANLAMNEQITGYGPQDPKMRAVWLEKYQPYSVKIGDKWYPYGKLGNIGNVLGMAADFAQFSMWAPRDVANQDMDAIAVRAVGAVMNNVAERSFMQGFSDLVQAINDHERYGESYVAKLEAGFAQPVYTGLLRDVKNAVDDTNRVTKRDPNEKDPLSAEFHRMLNEVKARTPGFSTDLPPRVNFWGEEVKPYEGSWINAFNAFAPKSNKAQPIDDELIRLRYPIEDIQPTFENVKLNPKQQYNLVLAANEIKVPSPEGGDKQMNMREYMNWLVASPLYLKQISDERKVDMLRSVRNKFVDAAGKYLITPGSPRFDDNLLGQVTAARALKPLGIKP